MDKDVRLIPLSALQHYAFCPRQCALIHNEQLWAENYLTAHGQQLHRRVDEGELETRSGIRMVRSVAVSAPLLGLTGKLDLLEQNISTGELTPVEYKRGKPKKNDCDAIQLCAQALCLEEMTGQSVTQGAIWYWQTRHRLQVPVDINLRSKTVAIITGVGELFTSGGTPKARYGKHCHACSLKEQCHPELLQCDPSAQYLERLFSDKDINEETAE